MIGPVEEIAVEVSGSVETVDLTGLLKGHRERVPPLAYLAPTRATLPDTALTELGRDAVAGIGEADVYRPRACADQRGSRGDRLYARRQTGPATTAAEALALGHGGLPGPVACPHRRGGMPWTYPHAMSSGTFMRAARGPQRQATPGPSFTSKVSAGSASTPRTGVCPDEKLHPPRFGNRRRGRGSHPRCRQRPWRGGARCRGVGHTGPAT